MDALNTSSVSTHQQQRTAAPLTYHSPLEFHTTEQSASPPVDYRSSSHCDSTSDEVLLQEVNHLMQCHWTQVSEIKSILQCTSSFFVLLYQRMFEPSMDSNTFLSPKTPEQKLRNMELVLLNLQQRHYDVTGISAAKVAQQDKNHIRALIRLFVEISRQLRSQSHVRLSPQSPYPYIVSPHSAGGGFPRAGLAHQVGGYLESGRHYHQTPIYTIAEVPAVGGEPDAGLFWRHAEPRRGESDRLSPPYREGEGAEEKSDNPREAYVDRWRNEISTHPEPLPEISMTEDAAEGSPEERQRPTTNQTVAAESDRSHHPARHHSGSPPQPQPRRQRGPSRTTTTQNKNKNKSKTSLFGKERVSGATTPLKAHRTTKVPSRVEEPPLTTAERRLLASHPHHRLDRAARDAKIERLRAAHFLGEAQQRLRQRLRQDYESRMAEVRQSLRVAEEVAHRERIEERQEVREANERYRQAYAALMEAAASSKRVPRHLMTKETEALAHLYERTLREGKKMCHQLNAERSRWERTELKRYSEGAMSWQQSVGP